MSEPDQRNSFSVTGPGGWGLQAVGREVILIIVLMTGLAVNAWILREGFRQFAASSEAMRVDLREEFRDLRGDHEAMRRHDQSLVCILAVPAAERTTAFRSGDPCAWILSGAATPPVEDAFRLPPRRAPFAEQPERFMEPEPRPRPRMPQVR